MTAGRTWIRLGSRKNLKPAYPGRLSQGKQFAICAVESYKHNVILPQESKSAFHFWRALPCSQK
jgi:hypothetical protein